MKTTTTPDLLLRYLLDLLWIRKGSVCCPNFRVNVNHYGHSGAELGSLLPVQGLPGSALRTVHTLAEAEVLVFPREVPTTQLQLSVSRHRNTESHSSPPVTASADVSTSPRV